MRFKGSKYGNKRTIIDGISFMSKKEASRYCALKTLLQAKEISDLTLQVKFPLKASNGKTVCNYIADFTYLEGSKFIVEDCKGFKTALYKLKKKWFEADYSEWQIRET